MYCLLPPGHHRRPARSTVRMVLVSGLTLIMLRCRQNLSHPSQHIVLISAWMSEQTDVRKAMDDSRMRCARCWGVSSSSSEVGDLLDFICNSLNRCRGRCFWRYKVCNVTRRQAQLLKDLDQHGLLSVHDGEVRIGDTG